MLRRGVVAGSGPNGLAGAIRLAQEGLEVTVHEAAAITGGATRTGELTLPGFLHDLGSAVHPLAVSSPFFSSLPLAQHGLTWIWPSAELAHPLDDGTAIIVERSVDQTAAQFGGDAAAYRHLFQPLVRNWTVLSRELLKPLGFPAHPLLLARFGVHALPPASMLAKNAFKNPRTRALFAGLAAHSTLPLTDWITASFGLVLGASAHAVGWPIPRGGSHSITMALEGLFRSLGGRVVPNSRITALPKKAMADVTLLDIAPRQFMEFPGVPDDFKRSIENFRYGAGVFKMDWALRRPIPWTAKECLRSATVHVGGSFEEIVESEEAVEQGWVSSKPFIILAQPSLFDPSRAPHGQHTAWAYCHVPNGFQGSALEQIESQIERFAPGFRECVLARAEHSTIRMQQWNENLVGGDINGGAMDWRQFVFRPTRMRYRTPLPGVFFCSASTPPGGGVHGMCGYWAAEEALRYLKRGQHPLISNGS